MGGLPEDEFSTHCQGMLSKLKHQPTNLPEEFEENWSEVASRRFDFERRERRQHLVEVCGLPEFRAFARNCVRTAPRLYVQIESLVARVDKQFADEGSHLERFSLVQRWEGSIDSCQEARNFRREANGLQRIREPNYRARERDSFHHLSGGGSQAQLVN